MILFGKEKQVSQLLMQHLEKVRDCLEKTYAVAEQYLRGGLEEAKRLGLEVDRIETEADELRRQIDDQLFEGAFLPNIRQDVHGLVSQMDDVANAAETVCDFILGERPQIPETWHEEMLTIFAKTLEQFDQFQAALTEFLEGTRMDVDEIRNYNQKVGILESDIDQVEWHLTREIFRSDLDLARKLHLRTCVRLSCQLSDQIENLADSLKLLVLKTQV
jgi:hypothetical protein